MAAVSISQPKSKFPALAPIPEMKKAPAVAQVALAKTPAIKGSVLSYLRMRVKIVELFLIIEKVEPKDRGYKETIIIALMMEKAAVRQVHPHKNDPMRKLISKAVKRLERKEVALNLKLAEFFIVEIAKRAQAESVYLTHESKIQAEKFLKGFTAVFDSIRHLLNLSVNDRNLVLRQFLIENRTMRIALKEYAKNKGFYELATLCFQADFAELLPPFPSRLEKLKSFISNNLLVRSIALPKENEELDKLKNIAFERYMLMQVVLTKYPLSAAIRCNGLLTLEYAHHKSSIYFLNHIPFAAQIFCNARKLKLPLAPADEILRGMIQQKLELYEKEKNERASQLEESVRQQAYQFEENAFKLLAKLKISALSVMIDFLQDYPLLFDVLKCCPKRDNPLLVLLAELAILTNKNDRQPKAVVAYNLVKKQLADKGIHPPQLSQAAQDMAQAIQAAALLCSLMPQLKGSTIEFDADMNLTHVQPKAAQAQIEVVDDSKSAANQCAANCGKMEAATLKCARCAQVWYHDAQCQKRHWKDHKLVCRNPNK